MISATSQISRSILPNVNQIYTKSDDTLTMVTEMQLTSFDLLRCFVIMTAAKDRQLITTVTYWVLSEMLMMSQ